MRVNVYIEKRTEFEILVYFITFLSPVKWMRTHSQERPYGVHIFTPSLFFLYKSKICAWKTVYAHFYAHFVRMQRLNMRPQDWSLTWGLANSKQQNANEKYWYIRNRYSAVYALIITWSQQQRMSHSPGETSHGQRPRGSNTWLGMMVLFSTNK